MEGNISTTEEGRWSVKNKSEKNSKNLKFWKLGIFEELNNRKNLRIERLRGKYLKKN